MIISTIQCQCCIILQKNRRFISRTDEQLLKHFTFYKVIEKKIISDCKKYNIKCIDTSEDREKTLNQLLKK